MKHPTATEEIEAVARGEIRVSDIVRRLLERVEQSDEHVKAWAYLNPDAALDAAAELDSAPQPHRPAAGLVFAAKDNFDTHDMPTAYGSPIHANSKPPRDASTIASLRLAGGLLLGKTISTEFAHVYPGPTGNPHNPEHTPGGSSSGSAAAVAAGMVHAAFGSQTTGSVIRPAAYCGTVGYKPTYGHINPSGMMANSPSFDTAGVITRSIDDMALIHSLLVGRPVAQVEAHSLSGLRVGIARTPWWDQADNEAQTTLESSGQTIRAAGAIVDDFDDLGAFDELDTISQRVSGFEFARTMGHERLYAMSELSADLRDGRMQTGFDTNYETYIEDQKKLASARDTLDRAFENTDVVISLPAPGTAPVGLRRTGSPIFNMPWTSLHTPAMTLPLFSGANGLPLGLQLSARRHDDARLFQFASSIEALFI